MLVAVALQGNVRRLKAWLSSSIMEGVENKVNELLDELNDKHRREIEEKLDKYIRQRRIFWRQRLQSKILPGDKAFTAHRDQILSTTKHSKQIPSTTKHSKWFGTSSILSHTPGPQRIIVITNIPLVTMGFGVVSLFVSVICFAASTQRPHVWLACVIVSMTTIACSLVCLAYMKISDVLMALTSKFLFPNFKLPFVNLHIIIRFR